MQTNKNIARILSYWLVGWHGSRKAHGKGCMMSVSICGWGRGHDEMVGGFFKYSYNTSQIFYSLPRYTTKGCYMLLV